MNDAFFKSVRDQLGSLTQSQVDGFNSLLAATDKVQPVQHRAYMLATAWWETARTMQPIEEYGHGVGHAYGVATGPWHVIYDGRGDVQLTWEANYAHATKRLRELGVIGTGIDLEKNPYLAMRADIAAAILVYGMTEGWFTGKKLSDCADYISMRRIINGVDHAADVALIAHKLEVALSAGPIETPSTIHTAPVPVPLPIPPKPASTAPIGLLQALINVFIKLFSRKVS